VLCDLHPRLERRTARHGTALARHGTGPARHWSGVRFTATLLAFRPLAMAAADRRSSMREFVHEPMKTCSGMRVPRVLRNAPRIDKEGSTAMELEPIHDGTMAQSQSMLAHTARRGRKATAPHCDASS
jgi:hypothetical protein